MPRVEWLCAGLVVLLACNEEPATPPTESSEATQATAEEAVVPPLMVTWPAEWIVSEEDDWVPVIDPYGIELRAARSAFREGDHTQAAGRLRAAADLLSDDSEDASTARGELRALATRTESADDRPSGAEFDGAIYDAYRTEVRDGWEHLHREAIREYMVAPAPHFTRAREAFEAGNTEAAARELREGAGWYALVGEQAGEGEDRESMARVVQGLRSLASAVEGGEVSDAKRLDEEFARVDHAYAIYYLHEAEAAQTAERWAQAGANLRAATQRLSSGLTWATGQAELEIIARARDMHRENPDRERLSNLIDAVKEQLVELRRMMESPIAPE